MALETTLQLLAEHMVFAALEREALRMLAFAAERKELSAGAVLFDQGEPTEAAYLVLEGEVAVRSQRPEQTEQRKVVGSGALLGESGLISPSTHPATAETVTAAVLLRIPRTAYRRILEEFPKSAQELRGRLAERLLATAADLSKVRASLEG